MVIIPGKDTLFHLLLYKASSRLSILPKKMIEEKTMYEEKKKSHTNPIPGKEGEIMNCNGNKCIECTVTQCANHCGSSNYCALDRILEQLLRSGPDSGWHPRGQPHHGPVHRLQVLPEEVMLPSPRQLPGPYPGRSLYLSADGPFPAPIFTQSRPGKGSLTK